MEQFLEEQESMLRTWINQLRVLIDQMDEYNIDQKKMLFVYPNAKPPGVILQMRSALFYAEACLKTVRDNRKLLL